MTKEDEVFGDGSFGAAENRQKPRQHNLLDDFDAANQSEEDMIEGHEEVKNSLELKLNYLAIVNQASILYNATQSDNDSDNPAKMIDSKNEEISESGFGEQHYQTMLESNDEKVISEMVTKFFNQTCDKDKCYVEELNLLDCFSCLKGFKDSDDTSMPSSFKENLVVAVVNLMKAMNTSDYSKITQQQMEFFYINKMKRRVANKSQ